MLTMLISVVMVLGITSTAFAAGETIYHKGYSKIGYFSDQSVKQKNDRRFTCQSYCRTMGSNFNVRVKTLPYSSMGRYISNSVPLMTGSDLIMSTSRTARGVWLRIENAGDSKGVQCLSEGTWKLFAEKR